MRGWQANSKTHLCVACNIRALPETEIPPALRGDIYCVSGKGDRHRERRHALYRDGGAEDAGKELWNKTILLLYYFFAKGLYAAFFCVIIAEDREK